MRVTRIIEFDMGHCLRAHKGFCYEPHGHRYALNVTVEGELISKGSSTGMIIDFKDLKEMMMLVIHDQFDHTFCIEESDKRLKYFQLMDAKLNVVKFTPTCENLAEHFLHLMQASSGMIDIYRVRLFETPNNWVDVYG